MDTGKIPSFLPKIPTRPTWHKEIINQVHEELAGKVSGVHSKTGHSDHMKHFYFTAPVVKLETKVFL